MMMKEMMIDLETLGVSRDSAILSAGIVIFDRSTVLNESHFFFDVREQLQLGRRISEDTVKWWLLTDRGAFSKLCITGTLLLKDLEKEIKFLYKTYDVRKVWSRGSMDLDILKECFDVPWRYSQERDVRTLDELGTMTEANGHDALGDCLNQVAFVQRILKRS